VRERQDDGHRREDAEAHQHARREEAPEEIRRVLRPDRDLLADVRLEPQPEHDEERRREGVGEVEDAELLGPEVPRQKEADDERDGPRRDERRAEREGVLHGEDGVVGPCLGDLRGGDRCHCLGSFCGGAQLAPRPLKTAGKVRKIRRMSASRLQ
jgi:hypothetical protein